jgi:hypothetical protein
MQVLLVMVIALNGPLGITSLLNSQQRAQVPPQGHLAILGGLLVITLILVTTTTRTR